MFDEGYKYFYERCKAIFTKIISIGLESIEFCYKKFKKSKFARAISYVFKIKIRIELPNALPEGRGE